METPRLLQKESAVLGDGLMPSQDMVECGSFCAIGMAALRRLIKLLRVAEQNQALCCLRNGQDVCQGHLPRLINKEHVHCLERIGTSPKPGRSASYLAVPPKS
jgi:hypothetical protein